MKKILSVILLMCMLTVNTVYAELTEVHIITDELAEILINNIPTPTVGTVGGEWAVLGLARYGCNVSDGCFEKYYKNVCDYVTERDGILHNQKYTEYSRVILALSAIGKNPEDVVGYNLLTPLEDYDKVVNQGLNGPIYALIALDSKNYQSSQRQNYVSYILQSQNDDGGFSLVNGRESDIDITAMAVQALSNYKDDEQVKNAIDNAVEYIKQNISYNDSESISQVLTALSMLNVNDDFTVNILNNLLSFYVKSEGFLHIKDSGEVNQMSTEQAFYALVAYERMCTGKSSLYDMSDTVTSADNTNKIFGLSGMNENISYKSVVNSDKTFSDIFDSRYSQEIMELAKRDIINGKSEDIFEPQSNMTRAEFAAITVKALGLPVVGEKCFSDVAGNDWYYGYVASAYKFGIVSGVTDTEFNPNGNITREQAAVMVGRCAKLCGNSTIVNDEYARNVLAQFDDYTDISNWAYNEVAYCVDKKIIADDGLELVPQEIITREEVAYMICKLLEMSNLL